VAVGDSGYLERLTELFEDAVMLLARQEMPGRNRNGHGPIDDLDRGKSGKASEERKLLRRGYVDPTNNRQADGHGLSFTRPLHRLRLGWCAPASCCHGLVSPLTAQRKAPTAGSQPLRESTESDRGEMLADLRKHSSYDANPHGIS
jgi:hypothetical protein